MSLDRADMSASVAVWLKGASSLLDVADRLRTIQLESLDFRELFRRYADAPREEALWYCDPPYVPETRVRGGYRHEMTEDDHRELVEILRGAKGAVLLSGYAHPVYGPLEADGWERREFETRIFCSGKNAKKTRRTECVWINPEAVRRMKGQMRLWSDDAGEPTFGR